MSYKIAVATSDGINVDETFGAAVRFVIYEAESGKYHISEERTAGSEPVTHCSSSSERKCEGKGGGCCGGSEEESEKVVLISDCRCVVCTKIGFHVQKQLQRKAISMFDVQCSVSEALDKITGYYKRIDKD